MLYPPPQTPSLLLAVSLAFLLCTGWGGEAYAQGGAPTPPLEVRAEEGGVAFRYSAGAGGPTASGEPYNPERFTIAHATLPFGTLVRVIHPGTGREVRARVNDRDTGGGFVRLSARAADYLGLPPRGGEVVLRLDPGEVAFLEERARRLQAQQQRKAQPQPRAREAYQPATPAGFTVQLGSFSEEARAVAKAGEVRGAWVLPVQLGDRRVWRVCYGVYSDRDGAAAAQAELAARGVEGFVKALVAG